MTSFSTRWWRTATSDKLWGVFIKDLASVDLEEDGKMKAQRLNVGFSRAKECVHFVLSKPLDGYSGAIGEALRHFWSVRGEAKKEHAATVVDPRSVAGSRGLELVLPNDVLERRKGPERVHSAVRTRQYLKQLDPTMSIRSTASTSCFFIALRGTPKGRSSSNMTALRNTSERELASTLRTIRTIIRRRMFTARRFSKAMATSSLG